MSDSPAGAVLEEGSKDVNAESESSTETNAGEQPERSMLDVVNDALAKGSEDSPTSTTDSEESGELDQDAAEPEQAARSEGEDPDEDDGELSEEEKKHLSERTQQRIGRLVADRKAAADELKDLKPKAERFEQIVSFAQRHQLSAEDVNNAFDLAAMVRNEPEKALPRLEALVQQIKGVTGDNLDPDLEHEVRMGYITPERARELSKAKAAQGLTAARAAQDRERSEREAAERRHAEAQQAAIHAADEWSNAQLAKDPDFKLKQGRITELVELEMLRTGRLPDPQEVPALLDRIHGQVTAEIKRLRPRPVPVDDTVEGAATAARTPEIKSTMDAINLALGDARS